MVANSEIRAALHMLMRRGADTPLSDDDFNSYALRIFHHQFELNDPYRKYCERRDRTPSNVEHWTAVPAVPTAAFKEVALVAGRADQAVLAFKTSGTTRGAQKRGTHYILDPSLYDASLVQTFNAFVRPDRHALRLLSLVPPRVEQPESSLSYMVSALGVRDDDFFASISNGLDTQRLETALIDSADRGEAVCLLGTSLAYLHWLDLFREKRLALAPGSRLMDTGGFKGSTRSIAAGELRARYEQQLDIPRNYCVNEYGMTELCSQYYDVTIRNGGHVGREPAKGGASWLRARVVNPDTLAPLKRGETGILQHFDLANLDSVSAVLTEDLAYEVEDGFVLLGRVAGAAPRGCSIAMDLLLSERQGGK